MSLAEEEDGGSSRCTFSLKGQWQKLKAYHEIENAPAKSSRTESDSSLCLALTRNTSRLEVLVRHEVEHGVPATAGFETR